MTSLAETQGGSFPEKFTRITFGQVRKNGSPAMASATSRPPAPMASMPRAPQVEVWLSDPSSVFPGFPKRSRWTWWQMPLPARESRTPKRRATDCRYRWSSAFSKPIWIVLWSM